MDQATKELVCGLDYKSLDTIEISGDKWKDFGFNSYQHWSYRNFDICCSNEEFWCDLLIAEQVFEDVLWPYRAATNAYRLLRPGGRFLISTPFLLPVHNYPVDCSRWTELGIKQLLAGVGLSWHIHQWSNRVCYIRTK